MGCGTACVKIALFIVNIFICLSGAGLLSFGIWAKVDPTNFNDLILRTDSNKLTDLTQVDILLYSFIAIGCILFVIGFLGCAGAACESRCMLAFYFVFVLLCLLILVAISILAAVGSSWLIDNITNILSNNPDALQQIENDPDFTCRSASDCATELWSHFSESKWIFLGISCGLAAIQIVALVFSCILCMALKHNRYE